MTVKIDKMRNQVSQAIAEYGNICKRNNFFEHARLLVDYLSISKKYNGSLYFLDNARELLSISNRNANEIIAEVTDISKNGVSSLDSLLRRCKQTDAKLRIEEKRKKIVVLEKKLSDIKSDKGILRKIFKKSYDKDAAEIMWKIQQYRNNLKTISSLIIKMEISKTKLRNLIRAYKKIGDLEARLSYVQKKQNQEKHEFEKHELVYAKAAAHDSKARTLAAQVRSKVVLNEICPYCGEDLGKSPHLDHIYPVSRGGLSTKDNLVFCCQNCNLSKSDKGLLEFISFKNFDTAAVFNRLSKMGKKI